MTRFSKKNRATFTASDARIIKGVVLHLTREAENYNDRSLSISVNLVAMLISARKHRHGPA